MRARDSSQPKNIEVTVQGSPSELYAADRRRWSGIDLEEAKLAAGLGLISMRERVHLAGGDFKLDSEPGAGTDHPCAGAAGRGFGRSLLK